jgi:hypothetical protein
VCAVFAHFFTHFSSDACGTRCIGKEGVRVSGRKASYLPSIMLNSCCLDVWHGLVIKDNISLMLGKSSKDAANLYKFKKKKYC